MSVVNLRGPDVERKQKGQVNSGQWSSARGQVGALPACTHQDEIVAQPLVLGEL